MVAFAPLLLSLPAPCACQVVNGSYINETYSNPEGIRCAVWEGPIILTANATFIIHFEQRASGQVRRPSSCAVAAIATSPHASAEFL